MFFRTLAALGALLFVPYGALAQDRIALVIGNGDYQNVTSVAHARDGAQVIESGLTEIGFDVQRLENATAAEMQAGIFEYTQRLADAEPGSIGFIYYVGHGAGTETDNYLLPADVVLDSAADLPVASVPMSTLLTPLDWDEEKKSIVVVDCCAGDPANVSSIGLAELLAADGNLVVFAAPLGGEAVQDTTFARQLADVMVQADPFLDLAAIELAASKSFYVSSALDPSEAPSRDPETLAWQQIESSDISADFVNFLETYPTGRHSDLAKTKLVALLATELAAAQQPAVDQPAAPVETSAVFFDVPLQNGDPEIVGQTLAELIKGNPLFPPVEGLPESYWKDQECSNCHDWQRANLCDQANTYLSDAGSQNLEKQHPYGGTFKQNLQSWARGGCE